MATHSSVLTWEIPQTEGPGGLQCLEWQWNILNHLGRREHEGESPCHPLLAFCPGDAPQIGGPVGGQTPCREP